MKFKYCNIFVVPTNVRTLAIGKWYSIKPVEVLTANSRPRICSRIYIGQSGFVTAQCTDGYIAGYARIGTYEYMEFPTETVELL